ncbi:MAG: alkane 1-monooxygenase [Deltaproteobacteria bacterium]|nr:MAG: alkane 1-monooxygenase [Deltaproteobacteria bacterium]
MTTASVAAERLAPALETARILARHLLCLVLPLTAFGFFWTAPHPWYLSLPWLGVVVASVWLDRRAGTETRQPARTRVAWPFDALLYVLAALQFVNLGLLVRVTASHGFWTMDSLVGWQLMGITSGYSGIVVAHELIHRQARLPRLVGRALLCGVLYEHFYTEHIRGHHARVATPDDPATARFGESYHRFFWRTVPAQFRHAWRLEARRLGDEDMRWWDPRLLRSRVVHGLAVEWAVALAILAGFGGGAFAIYLAQAFVAIRLLEAVNFFEHWGLARQGSKITPVDSWDTESWFTLYTLVGLSRHADHHAFATRPYQQLRHWPESPKLPRGYFGMVVMAFARNRRFQKLMTEELERRRLGPFATSA